MGSGNGGEVIVIIDSSDDEEKIQVRGEGIRETGIGSLSQPVELSPGFRNAAAMAGWDDESLLAACDPEVVATPDKASCERGERKRDARTPGQAITPASLDRVHRKPRRPVDVSFERLTIQETGERVNDLQKKIDTVGEALDGKTEARTEALQKTNLPRAKSDIDTDPSEQDQGTKPACLDQLRDELSCAVCLDICFEPSTTSCGHSFCRSCLQSAVSKCGLRCPKCRQAIKEQGAINIILWNTIQILFPDETARRLQSKKAEEEKASRSARPRVSRNQNSGQLPVDRSRPIGNFRRLAGSFRQVSPVRRSDDGGWPPAPVHLPSRRQQEELDAIIAARLQEEERRSSPSSYSGLTRFHRRLRNASGRPISYI